MAKARPDGLGYLERYATLAGLADVPTPAGLAESRMAVIPVSEPGGR